MVDIIKVDIKGNAKVVSYEQDNVVKYRLILDDFDSVYLDKTLAYGYAEKKFKLTIHDVTELSDTGELKPRYHAHYEVEKTEDEYDTVLELMEKRNGSYLIFDLNDHEKQFLASMILKYSPYDSVVFE